jgi:hypothetical protein
MDKNTFPFQTDVDIYIPMHLWSKSQVRNPCYICTPHWYSAVHIIIFFPFFAQLPCSETNYNEEICLSIRIFYLQTYWTNFDLIWCWLCTKVCRENIISKMIVFWDVAPCSLVEVYRRFRGDCCLHHRAATSQKTVIFILAAERTWNLEE